MEDRKRSLAEQFRDQAEECERLAKDVTHEGAKETMVELARRLRRLAEEVEQDDALSLSDGTR